MALLDLGDEKPSVVFQVQSYLVAKVGIGDFKSLEWMLLTAKLRSARMRIAALNNVVGIQPDSTDSRICSDPTKSAPATSVLIFAVLTSCHLQDCRLSVI